MSFLKSQEPNLGVPSQSRYCARPGCTHHHQRGGQDHLSAPPLPQHTPTLPSPHIRNKLVPHLGSMWTCYLFSLTPAASAEAWIKPYTWISYLASSRFPLIKAGQEPWSVSIITTVKTPKGWAQGCKKEHQNHKMWGKKENVYIFVHFLECAWLPA